MTSKLEEIDKELENLSGRWQILCALREEEEKKETPQEDAGQGIQENLVPPLQPTPPLDDVEVAAEKEEVPVEQEEGDEETQNQPDPFLGPIPAKRNENELILADDISEIIRAWLKEGINTEDKKEKSKTLDSIPRRNEKLNLEPPILDEEIVNQKVVKSDVFFKDYSNLTLASLAAIAAAYSEIRDNKTHDKLRVMERMASAVKLLAQLNFELTLTRRYKVINAYDDKAQTLMKKTEPTTHLFDGKLKALIESSKTLDKAARVLKPKRPIHENRPSLNWAASHNRREPGGVSSRPTFKAPPAKAGPSHQGHQRSRPYPNVPNKIYTQTQPQQKRH